MNFVQQPLFLCSYFLHPCGCCLEQRDTESDERAEDGGADPAHHDLIERDVRNEHGVDSRVAESRRVQTVDQREYERQRHCTLIDAPAPADETVEQRENDEHDDERIDHDEERNGECDDLRQTDIRCRKAEQNREEQQTLV